MAYYKCPSYDNTILNFPTIEDSISGSIVTFNTSMATQLFGLKVGIKATGGGGTPTTPIPIVGWNSVNVTRARKNLWGNGITTPDVSGIYWGWYLPYNTNAKFVFFDNDTTQDISGLYLGYSDTGIDATGEGVRWAINNGTPSTPFFEQTQRHYISVFPNNATTLEKLFRRYYIMVVIDNDDTSSYVPYVEPTIFTLPLGQTVYGGYVDWELGKLVVTHAIVDLGDLNWTYNSGALRFDGPGFTILANKSIAGSEVPNAKCSIYKAVEFNGNYSSSGPDNVFFFDTTLLRVRNKAYTDATTFKNAMSGVMLVYELATPIEISIPTTMPNTIQGVQNWFADSGDILELQYIETVKEYLNKHNTI